MGVDPGFGVPEPLPSGAPIAHDDAELRAIVLEHRQVGRSLPPVGLLGGDLWRTLGGGGVADRLTGDGARTFVVDLGILEADDVRTVFVAHVLVGRLFAGGTAILQAQWCDVLDLGPRSHPADGRLDVTTGRLPWRQRRTARQRARSGSHLPHPGLTHRQVDHIELDLDRPLSLTVDGRRLGRVRGVRVSVEPGALSVVV